MLVRELHVNASSGVEAEADPVHTVLRGEDGKGDERVEFVAVDPLRVSEAVGELVFPAQAIAPRLRRLLSERLERGRGELT